MSCAFTAAGISFSAWNGPPGAARTRKKASVAIAHSVGTMNSTRRRTNVTMGQRGPGSAIDAGASCSLIRQSRSIHTWVRG